MVLFTMADKRARDLWVLIFGGIQKKVDKGKSGEIKKREDRRKREDDGRFWWKWHQRSIVRSLNPRLTAA